MERVGASQRLRANAAGGGATPGAPAPSAPSAMGRRPLPRGLARVVWRQAADIVARRIKPGILVEVAIAAHSLGKVDGATERLAIGVVETIATQEDGTIQIGAQGLGALLGGRLEYTNVALFNRAGQVGSTLSATYTAGDPTASITSTAGWSDLDTEGYYYFKIGDEIFRATGRTGTSFTGVDGARLGTSAAASARVSPISKRSS